MKTWRERIAEAERRKAWWRRGFKAEDSHLMSMGTTCLMGEVSQRYGLDILDLYVAVRSHDGISWMAPLDAMHADDHRRVAELLDAIEDRAMQLKREHRDV